MWYKKCLLLSSGERGQTINSEVGSGLFWIGQYGKASQDREQRPQC